MTDFLDRFQDELEYVTGDIPVTDNIAITPVDIAAIMMSSGENYTSVYNQIMIDTRDNLISGTTRPVFSQTGEVLSADAAAARYAGYAKSLKAAGIALGVAGTGMEALREYNNDNFAGVVRESFTGAAALGGSYLVGQVVAPIATTAALAVGGGTVAAVASTAAIVATTAGVAVVITNYSDINASTIESQFIVGAEWAAEHLGFEYSNNPHELMVNFMAALPEHDVIVGSDIENITEMLTSIERHPSLGVSFSSGDVPDACFGAEVPIDMWPLDLSLKPGPDGIYDQDEVRAKVWKKPIELIEVGDIVVSFDEKDNLVPGPVTRTFKNEAKILLDFHGTRVTPGHVYYRPDSRKPDKFETLIDVLRDDGVIQHQDGTLIRAATNVPVGDPRDGFVKAITGIRKTDGTLEQKDEGRIRLGTRFLVGEGKTRKAWAVADLIKAGGGVVGDDELIRVGDGPAMPFFWEFGDTLPKPEDFVLACSGTKLEDIYKAAEWESRGPRLPAPMLLDRGQVQPLKGAALSAMPRNEPLDVTHAPVATQKPQRTLNRKQRKAMEAKQRKATKARKRVVG